ncbi:RNA-directed DNA polymerase, eukaryota, reverse transcriptase zinc-binding domain protein, partial [Tanacetum coccineum]
MQNLSEEVNLLGHQERLHLLIPTLQSQSIILVPLDYFHALSTNRRAQDCQRGFMSVRCVRDSLLEAFVYVENRRLIPSHIIHVRELSNWNVKIEDTLESEDGLSDNEQVESHSGYEASTKHEMKNSNVMDEPDDVTNSKKGINEMKEEELPQKHNHFDYNSTPLDDSFPPGFEFLKCQSTLKPHGSKSHKISHYSTSFAKYREKDFKGTSLLHEINHVIEVGGALGTIMSRGLSGGIISMWDPAMFSKENIWCNDNYVIVEGKWLNISHSYFMVNIYGPQDPTVKATLWSSLLSFAQHHQGRYVLFGDLNEVRDEHERFGMNFSRSEAQVFNKFVADSGLLEMMMEEVLDDNHNLKAIVLDGLWSDHSTILLHTLKTDYGPIPFKFFHFWFHRKDIDVVVKQAFVDTPQAATCYNVYLHEKLKFIKYRLKIWNSKFKKNEVNRKKEAIALLQDIDHKIDSFVASDSEKETRLQLLHEIHNIDRMESMDLFQKARIKWDIEGDENTKFFHSIIKQNRRRQAIQGIMVDGTWVSNPVQVKEAFLDFYKEKFQSHVPQSGLYQGDPLSPFIFILIMEGLHIAIKDATRSNLIKGVTVGIQGMRLSHFFYADDVVLVTEWNQVDMDNIIRIGVSNNDIEGMAWITGWSAGSFPFTYLDLPIGSSMKRLTHWHSLVDKFEARLSRWKAKLLSIGGRSTLVQAILGSVGIYYMSIFKVIHGEEAGLTYFNRKSKGVWANIIDTINHLHSKNIIPSNTLSYKVGCGSQVRFWIDNWTGDSPLYHQYHRLYRCLDMIPALKAELHSLSLSIDRDALRWGLTLDGSFTVGT